MKIIAILIMLVVALPVSAQVLTTDPQCWSLDPAEITCGDAVGCVSKYRMRLSPTHEWIEAPAKDGAAWFPMESFPKGGYPKAEIQAGSMKCVQGEGGQPSVVWTWSASLPFVYEDRTGNRPTGLTIITGP